MTNPDNLRSTRLPRRRAARALALALAVAPALFSCGGASAAGGTPDTADAEQAVKDAIAA
jgi:hypothetical protein